MGDGGKKDGKGSKSLNATIMTALPGIFQKLVVPSDEYKAEIEVILSPFHGNAAFQKTQRIAFAATFLLLRRRQVARLTRTLFQRNRYQLDAPPSEKQGRAVKVVKFGRDVCISYFVGTYVGMLSSDLLLLGTCVARTPLVPGRSAFAEELCPDMIRIYNDKDMYRSITANQDATLVHMMEAFARNCELRNAYEQKIRREQGLKNGAVVAIPIPGVPTDYRMDAGNEDRSTLPSDTSDEEWAKSLVADREEQMVGETNTGDKESKRK